MPKYVKFGVSKLKEGTKKYAKVCNSIQKYWSGTNKVSEKNQESTWDLPGKYLNILFGPF